MQTEEEENAEHLESIRRRWGGKAPPVDFAEPFPMTCDACAEATCAICGHEPCPCCVDCCDHDACLVALKDTPGGGGDPTELVKTHECVFQPCPAHH